jgi:hypothetical protein
VSIWNRTSVEDDERIVADAEALGLGDERLHAGTSILVARPHLSEVLLNFAATATSSLISK